MGRPFHVLKSGPQRAYDAIVIGAGIGGLMCANLLAREGLAVLLIEQHYMVGGYCSMFRRKGYTFDAATHFYPLLGNPQTMTSKLLQDLGITTGWIKMDPVDQFHFPDGSSFAVPADFPTYLGQLKAMFPEEAHALDDFFAVVKKAYMLGLLYYFRGRDTAQLDTYRDLTVQQVLDRYFRNRKLKLLLTADCPHWGSPPSRTSFVFDSMLRLSYFLGNYYPQGGSQAFADELAQRFAELGGHILMHRGLRSVQRGSAAHTRTAGRPGAFGSRVSCHDPGLAADVSMLSDPYWPARHANRGVASSAWLLLGLLGHRADRTQRPAVQGVRADPVRTSPGTPRGPYRDYPEGPRYRLRLD